MGFMPLVIRAGDQGMGLATFITSLPGKAARAVRGTCQEVRLRVRGTAYVTQAGQIRINPNPTPGVKALADDVFVAATTGNPVGRAVTSMATDMSRTPIGAVSDDVGTDLAVRMGANALTHLKRLITG